MAYKLIKPKPTMPETSVAGSGLGGGGVLGGTTGVSLGGGGHVVSDGGTSGGGGGTGVTGETWVRSGP
jgi:hypothetical protein